MTNERDEALKQAVEEALNEYVLEGPEADDDWDDRTPLELVKDFGLYLQHGADASTWFNRNEVIEEVLPATDVYPAQIRLRNKEAT